MIPFNKPFFTGNEIDFIKDAIFQGKLSGNGKYTNLCQKWFESNYSFNKCLLTSSCTDALEMAAILIDINKDDEVILPSYTFVSTANAFILRGAKLVFVDSREDHPGIDESAIESLITPKTKAIVIVHYAGVSCDMGKIMNLASKYNLYVIEDAAQSIDSYYQDINRKKKPLGSFGHLATFSFHETKNIISGEGGMLVINDNRFIKRSEVIWEKGTNRSSFFRGEVDKYGWVDIGSSFLPSEVTAAILWGQINSINRIQKRRLEIWEIYYNELSCWAEKNKIKLPIIPSYATNNAHMFYLVFNNLKQRTLIAEKLKNLNISAVFHYISLHSSPFFVNKHDGRSLTNSDLYSDCLLRLPLFYELSLSDQSYIINALKSE